MYRYTSRVTGLSKADKNGGRREGRGPSPEAAGPDERTEGGSFVRDAPTVLSYALLACYTFWLYAFGPALALLREELQFS